MFHPQSTNRIVNGGFDIAHQLIYPQVKGFTNTTREPFYGRIRKEKVKMEEKEESNTKRKDEKLIFFFSSLTSVFSDK